MRNPALHLVGIATSPGGGEVFGSGVEEELRQWLETRLDALGIDPVAYTRYVLSLLRCPDSALSPPEEAIELDRGIGRHLGARPKAKLSTHGNGEQRRAVVHCLTSAADDKYGVEKLVDELCMKLKELERGNLHNEKDESIKSNHEPKTNLEALTPRDRVLRYYAAFPALRSRSIKQFSSQKDKDFTTKNNNNNKIILQQNNNRNNRVRNKKTKMSINESRGSEKEEGFGFAKAMKRERERVFGNNEWERHELARLEAKFEKLELLWNSIPDAQITASIWQASKTASIWEAPYGNLDHSIWAAPTLSIPSGPLWPTDTTKTIFTLPTSDNGCATDTPQELLDDESPIISQNINLISIEDNTDECSNKDKTDESSWISWKPDKSLLPSWSPSPETVNCFFPSCKTPVGVQKESRLSLEVTNLTEPDEDLLTSERTHFRPIKEDKWADGTTFPVNNTIERIAYRRSESGNLLYLPGSETPYMEYQENPEESRKSSASPNFTLKFRVRQGCDKSVQTDPIRSPSPEQPEIPEISEISEEARNIMWQNYILYQIERICVRSDDLDIAKITQEKENIEENPCDCKAFALNHLGWVQSSVPLHNDKERRHSSSFGCQPLTTLRPLTL